MRQIDADKLEAKCKEIIAHEWNKKAAPVSWAHAYESFLDLLETAPTITADDYFDAVDRIKPCPNCRYTLLGALTEDVPRWIPVTERLPDARKGEAEVLTYSYAGGIQIGSYSPMHNEFYEAMPPFSYQGDVTHWMPLPEEPKEE